MHRWYFILFFCLLPVIPVFAQNENADVLDDCGHDPAALRAAIEAEGWVFDDLIHFRWSPTCQYLSMRLPSSHGDPGKTIVWNAATNTQVGVLEGFAVGNTSTYWDPNGEYLIVPVNDVGTYLWYVPANRQMLLNSLECGLMHIYTRWDYEHHLLYATSPTAVGGNWCSDMIFAGGLRVYDLNTGATVTTYPIGGYRFSYEFSDNERYMILSGYDMSEIPVQIWDRTTGQQIGAVDVDQGGGIDHSNAQIEISPDGRYLAIGMNYLRIWDLTASSPADAEAQQPTYRYPGPNERIREVHFVDNQTIETETWSGTQRWDVLTGAELPTP